MFAVGPVKKCADSMEAKIRQELESCLSKNADGEKNAKLPRVDVENFNAFEQSIVNFYYPKYLFDLVYKNRQCGHNLQSQNIKTLTSCISLAFRTGNLCRKTVFIEKSRMAVQSCDRHCSNGLTQNCTQKIGKLLEIGCHCVHKLDRQVLIQDFYKCSKSGSVDTTPKAYVNYILKIFEWNLCDSAEKSYCTKS